MRTLITVIVLSLVSQLAVGQKNFEGRIIYETVIPSKAKMSSEVYFGNGKVKMLDSVNIFPTFINNVTIIDFHKGILYLVNHTAKTYYQHLIKVQRFDSTVTLKSFPEKNRKIFGYDCSAFRVEYYSKLFPENSFYFWYADSLFYQVDKRYEAVLTTKKATNGSNILMGMEMIFGDDSSLSRLMNPISIIAEQIPDSVFSIPKNYKKKTEKEFFEKIFSQFEVTQAPPSPVTVIAPSSVPSKTDPDKSIIISLEKEGKVFLTMGKKIKKMEILNDINKSKALGLDTTELLKLAGIPYTGIPLAKLKAILNITATVTPEQMEGIPVKDSTQNELTDWIRSIMNVYQYDDTIKLEDIILLKGDPNSLYPDFKNIKYALKKNGLYKFRIVTNND